MSSHSKGRSFLFMSLSILTHLALAAGVMVVHTSDQKTIKDSTVVDIAEPLNLAESDKGAGPAATTPSETPPAATAPAVAPVAEHEIAAKAKTPEVASTPPPKEEVAQHKTISHSKPPVLTTPKADTKAVVETSETPNDKVEAQSTEAIEVPAVTEQAHEEKTAEPTPTKEAVAAATAEMNQETEKQIQEHETQTAALHKQNKTESEQAAKELAERRKQEHAALAAKEAAAVAALEKSEAASAPEEAIAAAPKGKASEETGTQESAPSSSTTAAAAPSAPAATAALSSVGSGEMRSIEQLSQMPGNQRPQYDSEDRRLGRQGVVSFSGFVSKEGNISDFKMIQSSGHRELDAKTLKALKSWKFKPGQEGLVEIPYQWVLKGEPQIIPATLRIKKAQVSQNAG